MRNLWKRIAVVMMAVVAGLSAFGCGSGLPEGKTIRISIGMWPPSSSVADVKQFVNWKMLFNMEHPEVQVDEYPYEYSPDTFIPMAESGETPTIFKTWFTEPQKLIQSGYVKDLTFIYEEKGWTDYLTPIIKDILSQDGKIYGLPGEGYALGLYMNTDHMKNAGLVKTVDVAGEAVEVPDYPSRLYNPADPTDLDTLTGVAIKLKQANDGTPAMLILSDAGDGGWQFSNIVWAFGGQLQVKDADGVYRANLNSDAAVAALEWIKALKHTYKVLPDATRLSYNNWSEYFGTGRVSMCFSGNDAVELPIMTYGMDKSKISIAPFPAGPGGSYALYGGSPFMISSSATDDEARMAVEFLRFMGRTPVDDEVTRASYRNGHKTALEKGMPVLPRIPVWTNPEYTKAHDEELEGYLDPKEFARFSDFYEASEDMLRQEEPYFCQDMYRILDTVIQNVLSNANADCKALLDKANADFQRDYMSKVK